MHPLEVDEIPSDMVQDLFNAIAPIEAQQMLALLEVSSFPQMKREGQNKTLNRLKKIAYSYERKSAPSLTTKELFESLRGK